MNQINSSTVAVSRLDHALTVGMPKRVVRRIHDGLVDHLHERKNPDPDWTPYPAARAFFTQHEGADLQRMGYPREQEFYKGSW